MATLLHVEDDDAVAVAFRVAVDEANIPVNLNRVSDGDQALEYLRHEGAYTSADRPDLVFLDLNMPKVDGWQVLAAMSRDKELCSIPVVVLSTSSHPYDKQLAYALGAKHYVSKPATLDGLVAEVQLAYREIVT